jgi:hypothetical protein
VRTFRPIRPQNSRSNHYNYPQPRNGGQVGFETDWKAAFKSPDTGVSRTRRATPQSLREGGFVKVVLADYEEV